MIPAGNSRGHLAGAILFSANRYVTNGAVSGITHRLRGSQKYAELSNRDDLLAVGTAVGRLNVSFQAAIPRWAPTWGSRDISWECILVSDINNSRNAHEPRANNEGTPNCRSVHTFQDLGRHPYPRLSG